MGVRTLLAPWGAYEQKYHRQGNYRRSTDCSRSVLDHCLVGHWTRNRGCARGHALTIHFADAQMNPSHRPRTCWNPESFRPNPPKDPNLASCLGFSALALRPRDSGKQVQCAVIVPVRDIKVGKSGPFRRGDEQLRVRTQSSAFCVADAAEQIGRIVPFAVHSNCGREIGYPIAVPVRNVGFAENRSRVFAVADLGRNLDVAMIGQRAPGQEYAVTLVERDDQIQPFVQVPVGNVNPCARAKGRRLDLRAACAERFARAESAVSATTEQKELPIEVAAIVRAGDQVEPAVAIIVHQLWTEIRSASPERNFAIGNDLVEPDRRSKLGLLIRPDVAEHPQPASILPDQQIFSAMPKKVANRWGREPVR